MNRTILAAAAAFATLMSSSAFAQSTDWGKWEKVGGDGPPPGAAYPGGMTCPSEEKLSGRHAYWVCKNRCGGETTGYCWEAVSEGIYSCPSATGPVKGFRRLEHVRYTKIPCSAEQWKQTVHVAVDLYGETWTKGYPGPSDPPTGDPVTPPTTNTDLPPTTDSGNPPSWTGGNPPWTPPEPKKTEEKKTDEKKTGTDQKTGTEQKTGTGTALIPKLPDDFNPEDLMNGPGTETPVLADPSVLRSALPSWRMEDKRQAMEEKRQAMEDKQPRTTQEKRSGAEAPKAPGQNVPGHGADKPADPKHSDAAKPRTGGDKPAKPTTERGRVQHQTTNASHAGTPSTAHASHPAKLSRTATGLNHAKANPLGGMRTGGMSHGLGHLGGLGRLAGMGHMGGMSSIGRMGGFRR